MTHFVLYAAILFGFFMACGVGANDVANAMGTSVGSKVLSVRQAIIIAGFFEALGAFFGSGHVAATIQNAVLDVSLFANNLDGLALGMLAALMASAIWLILATSKSWPVSSTHSIIGAVIGFAAIGIGPQYVRWAVIMKIAASWLMTPLLAGLIANIIFHSVRILIFDAESPFDAAKKWIPMYVSMVTFVIAYSTFIQTFFDKHHAVLPFASPLINALVLTGLISILVAFKLRKLTVKYAFDDNAHLHLKSAERLFGYLVVVTASAMAFAHGANDVANAIGPMATVVQIIHAPQSVINGVVHLPMSLLALGSFGVLCGLIIFGYKVIATVGQTITVLTPSRGFAAQLATALTVIIASTLGLPVSTTQTLVGAVLGVGMAGGIASINIEIVRSILMSWIITLPAGALFAVIFYRLLSTVIL